VARPPTIVGEAPQQTATRTVPRAIRRHRAGGGTLVTVQHPGLALIEEMAAGGRDNATIAKALGIHRTTLCEVRKRQPDVDEALERRRAAMGDELTDILLHHARNGVTVAAIFLAKARCGWREGEGIEPRTINNTQINIQIPEPMSAEEFARIIDGKPHG